MIRLGGVEDMFNIDEELKKLPAKPGVYLMHGEKDEIIYVGKAKRKKNLSRQETNIINSKGRTHARPFEL